MAMTIENDFLTEVKTHLRISHNFDDVLIKNEIMVATLNIFEQILLKQESDIPASSNDLSERQRLAIKHLVATYRTNPDERIESKFIPQTKRLIEQILGSERAYFAEY